MGVERRSSFTDCIAREPPIEAVNTRFEHAGVALALSAAVQSRWLNLDRVADVTIVVGGQRLARGAPSWSVDRPGDLLIEIRFRRPTSVSGLRVVSSEAEQSRTQEMTVWASMRRGERHREVLRKRFTFSPGGATRHADEYDRRLEDVSALHVRIVPSIDGRRAVAQVDELYVAA